MRHKKLSLQLLFDNVRAQWRKDTRYLIDKEAISLTRDRQEHTFTLRYHYEINGRMVKEPIAEKYSAIYIKLREFELDLSN